MKVLICICQITSSGNYQNTKYSERAINTTPVDFIINPCDESVLAFMNECEKKMKFDVIDVITVGRRDEAEYLLSKALAIVGHRGIIIVGESEEPQDVASMLSKYIESASYDLILCGREASDYQSGVVPAMLGKHLKWPYIGNAGEIKIAIGSVATTSFTPDETINTTTGYPAVISCDRSLAEPCVPSLRGIMAAKNKPITMSDKYFPQLFTKVIGHHTEDRDTPKFLTQDEFSVAANIMYSLSGHF